MSKPNPVVNSELSPPLAFKFEARGELQFRMRPQVESVPAFCLIQSISTLPICADAAPSPAGSPLTYRIAAMAPPSGQRYIAGPLSRRPASCLRK